MGWAKTVKCSVDLGEESDWQVGKQRQGVKWTQKVRLNGDSLMPFLSLTSATRREEQHLVFCFFIGNLF